MGLLIYVEGDTEILFYKAVVQALWARGTGLYEKIVFKNAKGIGNFQSKAARVFKNQVLIDNPGLIFNVALCYDTDVFEYSRKPPVDWTIVENDLKNAGAQNIYHIKAKKSIEDWFLMDYPGVLTYLRLSQETRLPSGNGIHQLETLFKKANKVYVKGSHIVGFVEHLDIQKIIIGAKKELKPLINALSI